MNRFLIFLVGLLVTSSHAFVPPSRPLLTTHSTRAVSVPPPINTPTALTRQRKSVAAVQLQGLFGLGVPEIGVILVAAAFLLGPQKLAELGKDAGKIAGELKEVPKEFQKGLEEGEAQAQALKSKALDEEKKE